MGRLTQIIDKFDLGITGDVRDENTRFAAMLKNFDAHTYKRKLIPQRDSEDGDSSSSTNKIESFVVVQTSIFTSGYAILALSQQANGKAQFLYKGLTISNSSDLSDALWTHATSYTSSGGILRSSSHSSNLFVYYRKTDRTYWGHGGDKIGKYQLTAAGLLTDDGLSADVATAITYTFLGQGIVHSKDDVLYIPVYNSGGSAGQKSFIIKNNNGSWTSNPASPALALPDHLIPVSICEYGNYLAIGCKPASGVGKSVVYLWDRDSSLATLSESIDWGEGSLQILEQIDGYLVGISYVGVSNGNLANLLGRFTFRYYAGGTPVVFKELLSEATFTDKDGNGDNGDLPIAKQKVNQSLYFLLTLTLGGVKHQGLWRLARTGQGQPFSLTLERTPNNDTALTAGTTLNPLRGFIKIGDYTFIAYTSNDVYGVSKTNDSASYTATSIVETVVLNLKDSARTKKLVGVSVAAQPLPSGGQLVLKYAKDENIGSGSWTTIFTNSTVNSISHEAINTESDGVTLPEFKEIQFRIESTGGAIPSALKVVADEIHKELI